MLLQIGNVELKLSGPVPAELTDPRCAMYSPLGHFAGQCVAVLPSFLCMHPATTMGEQEFPNQMSHCAPAWEDAWMDSEDGCEVVCGATFPSVHAYTIPEEDCLPSPGQQAELSALLSEFADIFSVGPHDIGLVSPAFELVHSIDTNDAPPTVVRARLSHFETEFLISEVKNLEAVGAIRPCKRATWLSRVVLVRKPDNSLRTCIDFRPLNAATVFDPYPLPRVEDCLRRMAGCRYHTSLDLVSGFWQVAMAEKDCHKTAFATPHGVYEWVRMPMGLVNSPATFQRLMDRVLKDLAFASAYMDDVRASSVTWELHMSHLRALFERIRVAGLKLKMAKCTFAARRIRYLGFIGGENGIETDPDKVACVLNLPPPTDAAGVRSFLGMTGFYMHYLDHYATHAAPLRFLTRKDVPFVWSAECVTAYMHLKAALTSAPVLRLPDFALPFMVTTDWSKTAIAAVLSQVFADGEEHPIAYASRVLTPPEANYAPTEGECLALMWGIEKFRPYLYGYRFVVYTDHKALEWLGSARFTNSKLERWSLRLQEYSFEVKHRPGVENVVADHLSRVSHAACHTLLASVWPTEATSQAALDSVPCTVCGDPGGFDNIAICDKCDRCFHLRCLTPPQSTPPTGGWMCPACDPLFSNLAELCDPAPVLTYAVGDPYTQDSLLRYVQGGREASLLVDFSPSARRSLMRQAESVRVHPKLDGWLLVFKKLPHCVPTWLVSPPVAYRWDVIRMLHDALGHSGIESTTRILHQSFHWRGMKSDVRGFIMCCDACQRRKLATSRLPPLQQPSYHGALEHVHVDLCGPFPLAEGKAWVQVMVDYFTKVAEFAVIPSKGAAQTARSLWDHWLTRYGAPLLLTSDNGSEFAGEFSHMLRRLGIEHATTAVRHPMSNGAAERLVKSFKDLISTFVNNHPVDWPAHVATVRMQYMSRIHGVIGVSPTEMLLGRITRMPLSAGEVLVASSASDYMQLTEQHRSELASTAELRIQQRFDQNARLWEARPGRAFCPGRPQFEAGDLVLEIDDHVGGPMLSPVLGPFRIIELKAGGSVAVLALGGTAFRPAGQTYERHTSLLSKYWTREKFFG